MYLPKWYIIFCLSVVQISHPPPHHFIFLDLPMYTYRVNRVLIYFLTLTRGCLVIRYDLTEVCCVLVFLYNCQLWPYASSWNLYFLTFPRAFLSSRIKSTRRPSGSIDIIQQELGIRVSTTRGHYTTVRR